VNILKQLRVLQAAVKQEKTVQEWQTLVETYALTAYSDLETDDDLNIISHQNTIKVGVMSPNSSFSSVSLSALSREGQNQLQRTNS